MQLTGIERAFINQYQGGFPLVERPFLQIAGELGCSENELIESVRQLRETRILTRFGPLYDAARLGGGLTLAAMAVPEARFDIITEMVNSYPEVAHNYRREHELNMWFVLATEIPDEIEHVLQSIENTTRLKVYNFPKQQEFYIGLWLQLAADDRVSTVPLADTLQPDEPQPDKSPLDKTDRKLVHVTQSGLELETTPYQRIADNIGVSQEEVLAHLRAMLDRGIIRRIGAVPNHYKLGLKANGMSVWQVAEEKISELGERIGQLDFVSHCYQRPPRPPQWPYNLFAMVHGHDRDEVENKAEQIKTLLGNDLLAHDILYSSAILKKTGMRLAA